MSHTHELDRRSRLPFAFGEVGEVHGAAAVGDGFLAEHGDGTPGRGVIDIEVGGDAAAERFDEAVVFEKIALAHFGVRSVVPDRALENGAEVFRGMDNLVAL